jgi:hypothetical protein
MSTSHAVSDAPQASRRALLSGIIAAAAVPAPALAIALSEPHPVAVPIVAPPTAPAGA